MKPIVIVGAAALVAILYFSFFSDSISGGDVAVSPVEETAVDGSFDTEKQEGGAQEISEFHEKIAPKDVEKKNSKLDELLSKVNGLSMFNQKGLDELRIEANQWIEEDPKSFEDFTIDKVINAGRHSTESMFFFVEAYAKKHPDPTGGIDEILKIESKGKENDHGHAEMGEKQKQNMAKAFALEVFFERLETEPVGSEGVSKLEGTIKGLVENEKDLMMVRQGLLVLRNYLDYSPDQLKEIVESRGQGSKEDHAILDLLKE